MEIIKEWGWTAFSALMLVAGVAMGLAGVAWFAAPWVAFLWYLVAVLPVGWPVVAETVEAFKEGDIFNEFLLMVVAAVGAFAIGEYPEGVAVMLFYAVGETLQDRAVDRARGNIRALLALRPDRVRVERGGQAVDCPPE
ncbi:MAG TPA: heavy metal translocating P-type ATPase, partial [Candidatus Caccomonas pullistercoris]|nr:heavy metal translocating P-type ATPase [Candidatus Caccomonas pullistercoris]